jgi:hypothetical protein
MKTKEAKNFLVQQTAECDRQRSFCIRDGVVDSFLFLCRAFDDLCGQHVSVLVAEKISGNPCSPGKWNSIGKHKRVLRYLCVLDSFG